MVGYSYIPSVFNFQCNLTSILVDLDRCDPETFPSAFEHVPHLCLLSLNRQWLSIMPNTFDI